jgi:hypothetical protein
MVELLSRDPRFDALRNALYHTERRTFLDRLNKGLNFLVIVFGAGVVGKATEHLPIPSLWLELAVVVVATAQLVFDFGSLARDHEFLQRRYYELLSEMESGNPDDSGDRKKWSAKLVAIAAEEPMTMRALDAVAYNKALDALWDDPDLQKQHRQNVRWYQYYFRNFLAYHDTNFHSAKS